MLVNVGITHRASIEHDRVVEKTSVTVRDALQLLDEVGDLAHVVLVQARELRDFIGILTVMGESMEGSLYTARRINTRTDVAPHLEGGDSCDFRHESQSLQIEHEPDVVIKGIRNADGGFRNVTPLAARIELLDSLNP